MDTSSIWAQIASAESQKADVEAEIAEIEVKLEALENAYRDLATLKDETKENKKHVSADVSDFEQSFVGENATNDYTSMYDDGMTLHSAYGDYTKELDDILDEILVAECSLNAKKNQKYGILGDLATLIENLYALLKSIVN